MTVELEAFAGHLLVVGGRAVRIPPPGALAEAAPRRVARTREGDRFFILVTPAGPATAQATFYEELARLAADVYFGSSGGVTGGLREALGAIHQDVYDRQEATHAVSALALALHGTELFAARSGRLFSVLSQAEASAFFPDGYRDPLELNIPPLGIGQTPDIQLTSFEITPGDTILIAGDGLLQADEGALLDALEADSVLNVIDQLKPLAGQQVFASVIRFATPGTAEVDGLAVQPGTRAPRRAPSRPAPVSLETPVEPAALTGIDGWDRDNTPAAGLDQPAAPPVAIETSLAAEDTPTVPAATPSETPPPEVPDGVRRVFAGQLIRRRRQGRTRRASTRSGKSIAPGRSIQPCARTRLTAGSW